MPKLSLSGPSELLAVLPLHLGFQPDRSVVVVCFHGRRLGLVARLDIPPSADVGEAAAQCLPALDREGPTSVALVGYESVRGEAGPLLDELEGALGARDVPLTDRITVHDGSWHCTCGVCPASGTPLTPARDVPAAAGYVALGACALPSRDAVSALFRPLAPGSPGHDAVAEAVLRWQRRHGMGEPASTGRAAPSRPARTGSVVGGSRGTGDSGESGALRPRVEEALAAWGALVSGDPCFDEGPERLVAAVGSLRDPALRDGLIAWLCPGSLPLEAVSDDLREALARHLGPVERWSGSRSAPGTRAVRPGADVGAESSGRRRLSAVPAPTTSERAVRDGEGTGAPTDADDGWAGSVGWFGDEWDDADRHRLVQQRLEEVCRRAPAAHAAPLLSLVASYAWWCGDGARAGAALDVALDIEPGHRLCRLLRQLVANGIRPRSSA